MRPQNRAYQGFLSLCIALALTPQAWAATVPPRVEATQTPDGAKVEIVLLSGEKVKGRLYGVSRDGVTVIVGKGSSPVTPMEVGFDEMRSFKQRPAVLKNILAGFGVAVTFIWLAAVAVLAM